MNLITRLPRTTTREWYYANRVALVRYHNQQQDPLVNKAKLADKIKAAAKNGMVTFYQAGTDCDGYRYCHYRKRPAAVMFYIQLCKEAEIWADGPYMVGIKYETHA